MWIHEVDVHLAAGSFALGAAWCLMMIVLFSAKLGTRRTNSRESKPEARRSHCARSRASRWRGPK